MKWLAPEYESLRAFGAKDPPAFRMDKDYLVKLVTVSREQGTKKARQPGMQGIALTVRLIYLRGKLPEGFRPDRAVVFDAREHRAEMVYAAGGGATDRFTWVFPLKYIQSSRLKLFRARIVGKTHKIEFQFEGIALPETMVSLPKVGKETGSRKESAWHTASRSLHRITTSAGRRRSGIWHRVA